VDHERYEDCDEDNRLAHLEHPEDQAEEKLTEIGRRPHWSSKQIEELSISTGGSTLSTRIPPLKTSMGYQRDQKHCTPYFKGESKAKLWTKGDECEKPGTSFL
jgi:hypothetical protein